MKYKQLPLAALALCVALGCGSGESQEPSENNNADPNAPRVDQNAVAHPKHPDVDIAVMTATGGGGGTVWSEEGDGYMFSSRGTEATGDGKHVKVRFIYDGTTDAGDAYLFEATINSEEIEVKKITYSGQEKEIDLGDGVRIIVKPDE